MIAKLLGTLVGVAGLALLGLDTTALFFNPHIVMPTTDSTIVGISTFMIWMFGFTGIFAFMFKPTFHGKAGLIAPIVIAALFTWLGIQHRGVLSGADPFTYWFFMTWSVAAALVRHRVRARVRPRADVRANSARYC